MTTAPTPTSGAADLRTAAQAVVDRWDTPLWRDVPATAEYIGRLRAALAAGQATAAQQASTVTNYTALGAAMRAIRQSIQMIGDPEDECMRAVKRVLRGAVIIVEDSGDEVAAPTAPAQPAVEASRFGSPELQAMIIARCIEKDQADSVHVRSMLDNGEVVYNLSNAALYGMPRDSLQALLTREISRSIAQLMVEKLRPT